MCKTTDLNVKIDGQSITVTDPQTLEQITYSKEGRSLVAYDLLFGRRETKTAPFLAQAWKAVHAEALKIGWLGS
jgi:hypothetical protein